MTTKQLSDLIKDEWVEQEAEPKPEPIGTGRKTTEPETKPKPKPKAEPKKEEGEAVVAVPRKNVAIRTEHALRLRAVKERELQRLGVDSQKVVSIRSLLDAAIEQYLKKME